MPAFIVAFLIASHIFGAVAGPAAVQVSADMSTSQGYKTFAERATAVEVNTQAE